MRVENIIHILKEFKGEIDEFIDRAENELRVRKPHKLVGKLLSHKEHIVVKDSNLTTVLKTIIAKIDCPKFTVIADSIKIDDEGIVEFELKRKDDKLASDEFLSFKFYTNGKITFSEIVNALNNIKQDAELCIATCIPNKRNTVSFSNENIKSLLSKNTQYIIKNKSSGAENTMHDVICSMISTIETSKFVVNKSYTINCDTIFIELKPKENTDYQARVSGNNVFYIREDCDAQFMDITKTIKKSVEDAIEKTPLSSFIKDKTISVVLDKNTVDIVNDWIKNDILRCVDRTNQNKATDLSEVILKMLNFYHTYDATLSYRCEAN